MELNGKNLYLVSDGRNDRLKSHFGCFLVVNYSSPSKESIFLGSGWGIRDVRGPYIRGLSADINIPADLFSNKIPSSIKIMLEASNLMKEESIVVSVTCDKLKTNEKIFKNRKQEFVLYPVTSSGKIIHIDITLSVNSTSQGYFTEIIAIEDITIERISE